MTNSNLLSRIKLGAKQIGVEPTEGLGYTAYHNVYKVTVGYNGKRTSFEFHDCVRNYERNLSLDFGDALLRFIFDALTGAVFKGEYKEFCLAFGYEPDSRKSRNIYKAVLLNMRKAFRLFIEDELIELQTTIEDIQAERGYIGVH